MTTHDEQRQLDEDALSKYGLTMFDSWETLAQKVLGVETREEANYILWEHTPFPMQTISETIKSLEDYRDGLDSTGPVV